MEFLLTNPPKYNELKIAGGLAWLGVLSRDVEKRLIFGENSRITSKFCKKDGITAKTSLKDLAGQACSFQSA